MEQKDNEYAVLPHISLPNQERCATAIEVPLKSSRMMVTKPIETGLLLIIITIILCTFSTYAVGNTSMDDILSKAEMDEFIRLPDELDLNLDPAVEASMNPQKLSTPFVLLGQEQETKITPNESLTPPAKATNRIENAEVQLARPSDPQSEFPVEPDAPPNGVIDIIEAFLESDIVIGAAIVCFLLLAGTIIFKIRKFFSPITKNHSPKKTTALQSRKRSNYTTIDQEQIHCSLCAATIVAENKFCTGCGTPVPETTIEAGTQTKSTPKHCSSCGVTMQPDVRFCTSCGHRFEL